MRRGALLGFALALTVARPAAADDLKTVTTLYGLDALANTLCLTTGSHGTAISNQRVVNVCSHLSLRTLPDQLVTGIQGLEKGAIVDLGTPLELATRYGYRESVGNGQGFVSIALKDGRLLVRKGERDLQPLHEHERLLTPKPNASVPVKVGHIYVVRIERPGDTTLYAKLLVVAHSLAQTVTIRWTVLTEG